MAMAAATKPALDASALSEKLRANLQGDVRFDNATRALYATDGSNYRQIPIGVVLPRNTADVEAAVSLCREFNAPLLCRGGGTSLAGQCCNVAVILDFSRYMNQILEIDPARRIARVQPGVVLDTLRNAAEKHHLTFGPDPASHDRCTLGGMIGNNSCGVHSVMAGKTDENIEALDVLTYDVTRMTVGATSPENYDRILGEGGRRAEIYSKLKVLAAGNADRIRQQFPNIPRRVSGYNLNHLLPENGFNLARALVGSEGTCATVLEATCRLVESPSQRVLLVIAYKDIFECADRVPEVLSHHPIGLEGFDDTLVGYTRRSGINSEGLSLLPSGGGWLLAEFGADTAPQAETQAQSLMQSLGRATNPPQMRLFTDPKQTKYVWAVRESALGATSHASGEAPTWEGWEDAAVAPEKLGAYLRDLRRLLTDFNYKAALYGHFGDGCVHNRINFDLKSKDGIAKFRKFMEAAAHLVVSYGGSLSGEHGDGQARAELLPKMFGPELMQAFREFKSAWDPAWKMNPGKVIDPNKFDENLRLGADYKPWQPETHFHFTEDHGSLAQATLRCVGVGKCRREEGGVMCPSYRVTHEEEHSTRGRAHLLWEMTQGEVIRDKWRSEEVKNSLELCLACKGCKSDCPTGVDVATYKAEFLSHHYEGRLRPRSAYAFGHIDLWARLASHAPGLVNLTTQLPFLRDIAKFAAGVSPHRTIHAFAPQTFRDWFNKTRTTRNNAETNTIYAGNKLGKGTASEACRERSRRLPSSGKETGALVPEGQQEVLLWPDTFNNYFSPHIAKAAVEVLEHAGFRVRIPRVPLCCGRPLYDFGFLNRAKALLKKVLDQLEPQIAAGIPIVGLEPSCIAVFRDELCNLFPNDPRARALSQQTFLLSEFLENHQVPLPRMNRCALLHGHCHHKSLMKMTAEESLLHRLGVDFQSPAPGCCGMAGSFGFEHDKYKISAAIGELELLPAVRNASPDCLIIADGFSCREQIAQLTPRRALHLAEVLQMSLHPAEPSANPYPESARTRQAEAAVQSSMRRTGLGIAAFGAGAILLALWTKNC
jgi:FAD/FMN-containing dehydrogenase/Fe-S oxidoreductase